MTILTWKIVDAFLQHDLYLNKPEALRAFLEIPFEHMLTHFELDKQAVYYG